MPLAQVSNAIYKLRIEADMRHLIDTYIETDEPRINSTLRRHAAAVTIENNVQSKIIKEHLSDPAYAGS